VNSQSLLPSQSGASHGVPVIQSRTGASDDVTLRLLVFTMLMAGVRFFYGMPGWIGRAGQLSDVQARLPRRTPGVELARERPGRENWLSVPAALGAIPFEKSTDSDSDAPATAGLTEIEPPPYKTHIRRANSIPLAVVGRSRAGGSATGYLPRFTDLLWRLSPSANRTQ
jgi:hypothetical protein